jgi:hypothetical protein
MLSQQVVITNPAAIIANGTDEDLLSNLDYVILEEPEAMSAKMELVRKKNRSAIAALVSPNVRILTTSKTPDDFREYLQELDIETAEYQFSMKP